MGEQGSHSCWLIWEKRYWQDMVKLADTMTLKEMRNKTFKQDTSYAQSCQSSFQVQAQIQSQCESVGKRSVRLKVPRKERDEVSTSQ